MKKRTLIMLILSCMACDPARLYLPTKRSIGTVTAIMNGKEWTKTYKNSYQVVQGYFQALPPCINSFPSMVFELYSTEGYLRQQLFFTKIPKEPGKYLIVPEASGHCDEKDPVYAQLFTATDDGCGAGDYYNVLAGEDNYIQVDKYDKKTSEIKGRFQITLLIEHSVSSKSILPDTLRFTDGRFHTKVLFNY